MAGVSTVVVVIFTSQQTAFVQRLVFLIWRSKHGWFDEREASTKNFGAVGAMAPTPLSLKPPGGGEGGWGASHTRTGPGRPPPWLTLLIFGNIRIHSEYSELAGPALIRKYSEIFGNIGLRMSGKPWSVHIHVTAGEDEICSGRVGVWA